MNNRNLIDELKPKTLKDIVGQKHLVSKDKLIYRIVKNRYLMSLIFYGPPGVGKTTLALLLPKLLKVKFDYFHAANDDKKKLTNILKIAKYNNPYILVVEEIHRMNKDKQDLLLLSLDKKEIIVFATTTENPYFVINPAIRSRMQILELYAISDDDLFFAVSEIVKKFSLKNIDSYEIIKMIVYKSNGDFRAAINILNTINFLYHEEKITSDILNDIVRKPYILNSKYTDEFHNLKSALHKSLRGSDVNASLHYLSRLLQSEDIVSISRRLLCFVYEDIGLANPNIAIRTYLGIQAAREVGFPECKKIFASIVIDLALSPKSNAVYTAYNCAEADVLSKRVYSIPRHIQDHNNFKQTKENMNCYKYPHDYPYAYVDQEYLPRELKNINYYSPPFYSEKEQILLKKHFEIIKKSKIRSK